MRNLVQHQRAAVRSLKPPRFRLTSAGEGAPLVTEQLSLEQVSRQRGAINLHQCLRGARRARVNERREGVFSAA